MVNILQLAAAARNSLAGKTHRRKEFTFLCWKKTKQTKNNTEQNKNKIYRNANKHAIYIKFIKLPVTPWGFFKDFYPIFRV